jgi:hypothetical protein
MWGVGVSKEGSGLQFQKKEKEDRTSQVTTDSSAAEYSKINQETVPRRWALMVVKADC